MGAAAVIDLEDHVVHSEMGGGNTTSVYAAELYAIEIALESVINSTEPWAAQVRIGLGIFADSQAALNVLCLQVRSDWMPRPHPPTGGAKNSNRTPMDPGSAKSAGQRDRRPAHKRSGPVPRRFPESSQSICPPCSCDEGLIFQRDKN